MKFLHKTQVFLFRRFSKQQNSAIKVVGYRKMPVPKMLYMKLGYKVINKKYRQ